MAEFVIYRKDRRISNGKRFRDMNIQDYYDSLVEKNNKLQWKIHELRSYLLEERMSK